MRVVYEGGPRGFYLLTEAFKDEGVEVRYDPPVEHRGVGGDVVNVVVTIIAGGIAGAVSDALKEAVKRAVSKVRERFPQTKVDIKDD